MNKFLIEVPHTDDPLGCARAIQVFMQSGSHYLTHAEWGCRDGVHSSWMIVEANDRQEAIGIVPPAFRSEAKVVRLSRFSSEEIDEIIQSHGAGPD